MMAIERERIRAYVLINIHFTQGQSATVIPTNNGAIVTSMGFLE